MNNILILPNGDTISTRYLDIPTIRNGRIVSYIIDLYQPKELIEHELSELGIESERYIILEAISNE